MSCNQSYHFISVIEGGLDLTPPSPSANQSTDILVSVLGFFAHHSNIVMVTHSLLGCNHQLMLQQVNQILEGEYCVTIITLAITV